MMPNCRAQRRGGRGHPVPRPFNRYFEPENLRAAARVLRAAGYRPVVARPPRGARPLDSGRTYLAAGLVDQAREEARRTLTALAAFDLPVIGIEPSCLLTLRDEFLSLLPGAAAAALSARALLIGEFLAREKPKLALNPWPRRRMCMAIATRRRSPPSRPPSPC